MAAIVARLSGEDWQKWGNLLLARHYGPTEYQKIPDNQKGDAGLEGFTVTSGHAYQAYGCEEPISTALRYEKQRIKITDDIGKFVKNQKILEQIFGAIKITRWVLFVPFFDSKDIVAHASKKTTEVLNANLGYVADGFRVMICDEEIFQIERDRLLNATNESIRVSVDQATSAQVTSWAAQNDGPTATLEEKIGRLPTIKSIRNRQMFRNQILKWYLEGQELLATLRKYPDIYEKVIASKSHRENYLVTSCLLNEGATAEILSEALDGMFQTFKREVKELSSLTSESLAHEAVSDWLLRCPLDFPEIPANV